LSGPPGLPLVDRPPEAVLFRHAGKAVSAVGLLQCAQALAASLPPGRHLLNLCRDRYAFIIAFLAALLRDQVCLLTGERSAGPLARLAEGYPGCVVATDDPQQDVPAGLPLHLVRPGALSAPFTGIPSFPAERLAAIVFTSGSTGAPVSHAKRWGALVQRSRAAAGQFGLTEAAPAQLVGTVPPQHMYGFETTVLLPLHAPATSWCGPAFFPEDVRAALAALPEPRLLVTTPLQLGALLRAGTELPPLMAFISATAPLEGGLAAEAEARWRAPVLEIFGATEVGSIASRRTLEGNAWRLYPGINLTEGEISAPHAPPVLLDDAVEALDATRFRLLGRRQDIIKLAGRRASLAGLNRILLGLDGVEDGTFLAPPDLEQRATARLLAVVVAPGLSAGSIMEALRGRIDPIFLPRRIAHVSALPRNEFGKLRRERLLELLAGADAAAGAD
jgi:acyl-coenzyme A synthetase/AMP-(fatty) acid ligase